LSFESEKAEKEQKKSHLLGVSRFS